MKKFIVLAALLVLPFAVAEARVLDIPQGHGSALAGADYGGVDIATVTYSSAGVLLFGNGGGSISWIHFTTVAAVTDFAIIRTTRPINTVTGVSTDGPYMSHVSGGPSVTQQAGNDRSGDYNTGGEMFRLFGATVSVGILPGAIVNGFDYAPKTPMRINGPAIFKLNNVNWGPVTIGYTKFSD